MIRNKTWSVLLFIALSLTVLSGHAQERYKNAIFSDITRQTDTYSDTLKLDFYSAKGDTVSKKPLLILVHGGGFAIGKRDNILESRFSGEMAKRGYAVASISYRLTRKGKSFSCDCPTKEKIETFLAVSEDILKAAHYLADRSIDLKFDPSKMILVGSSAGAEAVLNTAFLQFHRDFNDLSYGNLKFAGVVSFAGAVLNADYITPNNAVPTLLFHGEKDNLVPFGTAAHHFCKEFDTGFIMLNGSQTIAQKLHDLNTSYTLIYDPDGNHSWANLPYSLIERICDFIRKNIIDEEHHQFKIKMSALSQKN